MSVWEARNEPVDVGTWAGFLQIEGIQGWHVSRACFGSSAIQATLLTWVALREEIHSADPTTAFLCGEPGAVENLDAVPIVDTDPALRAAT